MLMYPSPELFTKLCRNLAHGPLRARCLGPTLPQSAPIWVPERLEAMPFLSVPTIEGLHEVLTDWFDLAASNGARRDPAPDVRGFLFGAGELLGCLAAADPVWTGAAENVLNHCLLGRRTLDYEGTGAPLVGFAWFDDSFTGASRSWSMAPWSHFYLPVAQLTAPEPLPLYAAAHASQWRLDSLSLAGGLVSCFEEPRCHVPLQVGAIRQSTIAVYSGVLFGLISAWLAHFDLGQCPRATLLEARWFVLREHLRNTLADDHHAADAFWSIAWMLVHELASAVLEVADAFLDPVSQQLLLYLRPLLARLDQIAPALAPNPIPFEVLGREKSAPAIKAASAARGPKTALAGLTVLDFTRLYPGPAATMLLAELGADVIRVEDPGRPDGMRLYPPYIDGVSAGYLAVNRGKRSLSLDLSRPESRDVLYRMLPRVDVVIEGFKPGTMQRFGMDWAQLEARFPHLVYLSLSGYGQSGPLRDRAGHDINYLAESGWLGLNRSEQGEPVLPGGQVADMAGGAYLAAFGALVGVAARDRHGRGQWLDLAMMDGVLPLLNLQLAHHWATGESQQGGFLSGALACYRVYRCRDDRFVALGALEPKFWHAFCAWADQPSWQALQFVAGEEQAALIDAVGAFFAMDDRDLWTARAANQNFCLTPVRDLAELANCAHLQARGMLTTQTTAAGTTVRGVANPLKCSMTPARVGAPAPVVGADSQAILAEMGFSRDEIEALTGPDGAAKR